MLAYVLTLAFATVPQATPTSVDVECWIGTSGTGRTTRRTILELEPGAGSGRLTILQRTVDTRELTSLTDSGGTIAFALAGSEASFRGQRDPNGRTITGDLTLRRGSEPRPVTLQRVSPNDGTARELHGHWAGQIIAQGFPARVVLRFVPTPCGASHLFLDSPDQASMNLPSTALSVRGDSVYFGLEYLPATFHGVIDTSGTRLSGEWRQLGMTMELTVQRTDSASATRRPQDPVPPFPYRAEDVKLQNGGITLAGTLTIPEGRGPHPAILLLSGSGAQDRDETVAGHRPFLVLADTLTRAGVAVLRMDDRGIGGSGGEILNATLEDNASDASAALRFLAVHSEIDVDRIGLLGHSEGGLLAPLVARRDSLVRFVVLLAGPAMRGASLIVAQQRALARAAGEPEEVTDVRRMATMTIMRILREEPNDSIAQRRADSAMAEIRAAGTSREQAIFDSLYGAEREANVNSSWSLMTSPWFRHLSAFDPAPYLSTLRAPALTLFAQRDLQVPAERNAELMRILLRRAGNPDATVKTFEGLNHLFQHATTGLPDEYAMIDETIAPEVLRTIVEWIVSRAKGSRTGGGR
jgi:pimeloyl-ACP methyl ester carboxylesterase